MDGCVSEEKSRSAAAPHTPARTRGRTRACATATVYVLVGERVQAAAAAAALVRHKIHYPRPHDLAVLYAEDDGHADSKSEKEIVCCWPRQQQPEPITAGLLACLLDFEGRKDHDPNLFADSHAVNLRLEPIFRCLEDAILKLNDNSMYIIKEKTVVLLSENDAIVDPSMLKRISGIIGLAKTNSAVINLVLTNLKPNEDYEEKTMLLSKIAARTGGRVYHSSNASDPLCRLNRQQFKISTPYQPLDLRVKLPGDTSLKPVLSFPVALVVSTAIFKRPALFRRHKKTGNVLEYKSTFCFVEKENDNSFRATKENVRRMCSYGPNSYFDVFDFKIEPNTLMKARDTPRGIDIFYFTLLKNIWPNGFCGDVRLIVPQRKPESEKFSEHPGPRLLHLIEVMEKNQLAGVGKIVLRSGSPEQMVAVLPDNIDKTGSISDRKGKVLVMIELPHAQNAHRIWPGDIAAVAKSLQKMEVGHENKETKSKFKIEDVLTDDFIAQNTRKVLIESCFDTCDEFMKSVYAKSESLAVEALRKHKENAYQMPGLLSIDDSCNRDECGDRSAKRLRHAATMSPRGNPQPLENKFPKLEIPDSFEF